MRNKSTQCLEIPWIGKIQPWEVFFSDFVVKNEKIEVIDEEIKREEKKELTNKRKRK